MLSESQIAAYEERGFRRWTKGKADRLYASPRNFGCEFDYYGTGNIRSCRFNGERVSNADGYRLKSTKAYVDVRTGELSVTTSTSYEDEIREAIEAIMAEVDATRPIWADLRDAIVTANGAVCRLSGYGICMDEPVLGDKVRALADELSAWVLGMEVLAEEGAANVDRRSVMEAAGRRSETIREMLANGGEGFES